MGRSELGVLSSAVAAVALVAVAASIIGSLARSGPLRRNRLDLAAALVFGSSGVGHAIHAVGLAGEGGSGAWYLSAWEAVTAVAAVAYLWLRRVTGLPEEGGTVYEAVRHRQHELAGQVMAANVQEALAAERAAAADLRLARVFAAASVGMAVVDRAGRVTRANPALCTITGRDLDQVLDAEVADLFEAGDRPAVEALVGQGDDVPLGIEVNLERPDGAPTWGRVAVTPYAEEDGSLLVQVEDATGRRQAEERLEHLALHDPLTGLANRHLFQQQAAAALRQGNRTGCYVGCLFVDLDRFKVVNDSLGHAAGDRVLTTTADRLVEAVRPDDLVARMGGDDFCILLVGLEHQAEAEVVAERVRQAADGIVDLDGMLDGGQVATSVSIGVAVALPGDRSTPETLVRDADTALCRAKAAGPSRTVVFDVELREDARRQLHMEAAG